METCDTWREAHNFSCRMIADLKAKLITLEIPTGGDGGQTSEQRAGDRTESQPIGGDAEDSEESDEDEEDDEEEGDE